ncbi:MAG TPA: class I SAM-dependent methyltransferase [Myxococcales bacterium]
MTGIDEAGRTSFDRKAGLYDAMRPSYAEAMVDEVIARSGISPEGKILEIGAGTGKATLPFARRGRRLLALEPGANMAAVLRRNVASFPGVEIEITTFEAWGGADGSFDLVISAQALHWIDPAVRYAKAAAALRPKGALALIRNEISDLAPEPLRAGLQAAYARFFPAPIWTAARNTIEAQRRGLTAEIEGSGLFDGVHAGFFPCPVRYSRRQYLDLLDTHSDHALLAPEFREPLYQEIGEAIDRHGGSIEVPYVSMVLLAFRAA